MKCPGQDSRYWKPGAIFDVKCPKCGATIEFFKDDTKRRCPGCGETVPNPEMDFGCAAYCPYAEHCLGSLPEGVVADGKFKVLKGKMFQGIRAKAGGDGKRVAFCTRFLEYIEDIGKKETAKLGSTLMAGYCICAFGLDSNREVLAEDELLHDMKGLGAEDTAVEDALKIIKEYVSSKDEPQGKEVQVLHDAMILSRLDERDLTHDMVTILLTETGRQTLKNILAMR